jgi:hypothetical protein
MRVISTIEESHAHGQIRDIYVEVERTLGVPFPGMIFRSLATREGVLESVWPQIKRNAETQAFVDLANRLRRNCEGVVPATLEFDDVFSWLREHHFTREDLRVLRYCLEMLHSYDPKLLLITAAISVNLHGIKTPKIARTGASRIASTEPHFPTKVSRVMFDQAPSETKEIYLDVMDAVGVPAIPDDFQILGSWPTLLRRLWNDLKPVMHSATFQEEANTLSALAIECAQELPYPVEVENDSLEVRQIVDMHMSLYSRTCPAASAARWMLLEGERVNRAIGRAAGEADF